MLRPWPPPFGCKLFVVRMGLDAGTAGDSAHVFVRTMERQTRQTNARGVMCSTAIRRRAAARRGVFLCVLRDGADCGSLDDERASMRLASIHLHRETMRWMTRRMSRIKKNQERGSLIIVTLIHTHVWHARAVVAAISYRGN